MSPIPGSSGTRNKHSRLDDAFVPGGFVVSPTPFCDLDVGFKYGIEPKGTALAGATIRFEGPKAKEKEKK